MKGYILLLLCLIFTISSIDTFAYGRGKHGKSNVYIGKRYKGHKCPPKRKIINAKYY